MQCPKCDNPMEVVEFGAEIAVNRCTGCRGLYCNWQTLHQLRDEWLADTVLYRANLIPERQRIAFLQLLGMPLRPARPARGLVSLGLDEKNPVNAVTLAGEARLAGPVETGG